MNQQRSRRFKTAKEQEANQEIEKKVRNEFETAVKNSNLNIELPKSHTSWDHNVITPGTKFMDLLALNLRYFVDFKIKTDPLWKNVRLKKNNKTLFKN